MEVILTLVPLKTWVFAAGFGGLVTVIKKNIKIFH